MGALLTKEEWRRVEAYDKTTAKELDAQENPVKPKQEPSLYELLEAEGLDNIRDYTGEIAFFQGLRERNAGAGRLVQWCDYFIRLYKNFMGNEFENLRRWRHERESCGL